jgi:hypothetical protein
VKKGVASFTFSQLHAGRNATLQNLNSESGMGKPPQCMYVCWYAADFPNQLLKTDRVETALDAVAMRGTSRVAASRLDISVICYRAFISHRAKLTCRCVCLPGPGLGGARLTTGAVATAFSRFILAAGAPGFFLESLRLEPLGSRPPPRSPILSARDSATALIRSCRTSKSYYCSVAAPKILPVILKSLTKIYQNAS